MTIKNQILPPSENESIEIIRHSQDPDRVQRAVEAVATDLEELYDAIRGVRASKTPATWTDREKQLFALLPEGKKGIGGV